MGEPRWEVKTAIQEEGFTFTELLVAITILALVSIPVLSMLLNGYSYTVMAGRQTVAANLCRDKIEELKSEGFSKYDLLIRDKPDGRYQIPSADMSFTAARRSLSAARA
jgi:prepilin-type N-terminal cleavage/methylation domain-containing protein